MQTKMIPSETSSYYCSFKHPTARTGGLDSAWQNSEVAKRTGDFGNYIQKMFFRKFSLKAGYLGVDHLIFDGGVAGFLDC